MNALSVKEKVSELKESLDHIDHFVKLVESGKISYLKPLAVELRKLLCPGRGNSLLQRIERSLNIQLQVPVRAKPLIPLTYGPGTLSDYMNECTFVYEGKVYSRYEILQLVANQKGAHLDNTEDKLHKLNVSIYGVNPATYYISSMASTILKVCREQISFS